ncbi:hypothetical protein [Neptuniibacter caesariensis]|uniref:DUF3108 domain-containing protein n=1 Tax=Neptuniibacter caesariensis TaxID=207954 RepID=A0A7U8C5M6_NEPCE|nr:hypothetical protein [Neptuniibacter caesariensis]EAR60774.1 hypothetical protein MED92_13903 [Neptuniibacter caesariensis]
MRYLGLVLLFILLQGCEEPVSSLDYFPLNDGLEWEYRVTESFAGDSKVRPYSVSNQGKVDVKGEFSASQVYLRRTSDGTDYFILSDETGRYRIAKRTLVELRPRFDDQPRMIMSYGEQLSIGESWQVETRSYSVKGISSHSLPDPAAKTFNLAYEITATDETVRVPAGVFNNCVKVEAKGVLEIYADPRLGFQEIQVRQTEWYAPGVGLIKLIREEPMDLELFKGGSVSFELISFSD